MRRSSKLAIALNSWLTFEHMCHREKLFSESYLAYAIGLFLGARYGSSVTSEYEHPVLSPLKEGVGDKPRLDFAVLNYEKKVLIAIETKWISSSTTLVRDIIRDMIRLELMHNKYGCQAWLILAGKKKAFDRLVSSKAFRGHPEHIGSDPILPYGSSNNGILRLDPLAKFRKLLLGEAIKPFHGIELPKAIHTAKFGPFPEPPLPNGYVAYLWKISSRSNSLRFKAVKD